MIPEKNISAFRDEFICVGSRNHLKVFLERLETRGVHYVNKHAGNNLISSRQHYVLYCRNVNGKPSVSVCNKSWWEYYYGPNAELKPEKKIKHYPFPMNSKIIFEQCIEFVDIPLYNMEGELIA